LISRQISFENVGNANGHTARIVVVLRARFRATALLPRDHRQNPSREM